MKLGNRGRTIGIGAMTVLGVLACGDALTMTGDAMVDAGEALLDAGREVDGDAAAQAMTFEAECEPHVTSRTTDRASGEVVSEVTTYYAEVNVPGFSPDTATNVLAIGCDAEVFGVLPESCIGEWICERTPVDPMACVALTPEMEPGRLRVRCGGRSVQQVEGAPRIVGSRWTRVRFVVE